MINGVQLALVFGAAAVASVLALFPPQLEVSRTGLPAGDGSRPVVVVSERPVGRPDGAGEYRRDTTRLLAECALVVAVAAVLVALAGNRSANARAPGASSQSVGP
jgi:hypothetical protein